MIVDSEAHELAAERLLAHGESVYRAFESLALDWTAEDVAEYLEGSETWRAIPEALQGSAFGVALVLAMVAVERDRLRR